MTTRKNTTLPFIMTPPIKSVIGKKLAQDMIKTTNTIDVMKICSTLINYEKNSKGSQIYIDFVENKGLNKICTLLEEIKNKPFLHKLRRKLILLLGNIVFISEICEVLCKSYKKTLEHILTIIYEWMKPMIHNSELIIKQKKLFDIAILFLQNICCCTTGCEVIYLWYQTKNECKSKPVTIFEELINYLDLVDEDMLFKYCSHLYNYALHRFKDVSVAAIEKIKKIIYTNSNTEILKICIDILGHILPRMGTVPKSFASDYCRLLFALSKHKNIQIRGRAKDVINDLDFYNQDFLYCIGIKTKLVNDFIQIIVPEPFEKSIREYAIITGWLSKDDDPEKYGAVRGDVNYKDLP